MNDAEPSTTARATALSVGLSGLSPGLFPAGTSEEVRRRIRGLGADWCVVAFLAPTDHTPAQPVQDTGAHGDAALPAGGRGWPGSRVVVLSVAVRPSDHTVDVIAVYADDRAAAFRCARAELADPITAALAATRVSWFFQGPGAATIDAALHIPDTHRGQHIPNPVPIRVPVTAHPGHH
ncbi:MAG TPA: hypothetical protein VGD67_08275 [Pseudonocardiaceae bacterium]